METPVLPTIAGPGGIAARGHIKELQSTLTQVFFFPCWISPSLSPVHGATSSRRGASPNRYLSLFWNTCCARRMLFMRQCYFVSLLRARGIPIVSFSCRPIRLRDSLSALCNLTGHHTEILIGWCTCFG